MSEALIVAVHERPVLWSSQHPQHKSKQVVSKAWEEVKQIMQQYEGKCLCFLCTITYTVVLLLYKSQFETH